MLCTNCKSRTVDNAAFCHACGAPLASTGSSAATRLLPDDAPSTATQPPSNADPSLPVITRAQPVRPTPPVRPGARQSRFELADVLPEVRQGAIRGAIVGGISGPLLGALAGAVGQGGVWHGALRGTIVALVGAVAGAVIGLLRAQPSGVTHATSSSGPGIAHEALNGAVKGAVVGAALGAALVIQSFFDGPFEAPANPLAGILLFALAGGIGGAIVGLIQAIPRDRRRRRPPRE
ncbi:MAG: zinc ribbon domain-containing protein [Armatimonadota bacterium]|nr:zinc ribbon domain-containing protein [Armatimonadota bacterium]